MEKLNVKKLRYFANFLNSLARDLTNFYYKGHMFILNSLPKIKKKFPSHEIIGEEYGYKKTKSDFTWIIDPIDGTRSYVIGNPTWSNLISLNYKGSPILGLANFPKLKKHYYNISDKVAYVVDNKKGQD